MPSLNTLLIVQPWFCAPGHPAQSLLNTAKVIKGKVPAVYLVGMCRHPDEQATSSLKHLMRIVPVHVFKTRSVSIREGTVRALLCARRMFGGSDELDQLFFFDGHLVLLAIFWPFVGRGLKVKIVSILELRGPERIQRNCIANAFVARFLSRTNVRLYARTEELAEAWRKAYRSIPEERIRYLPSLEILDDEEPAAPAIRAGPMRFGSLGQIRTGKCLEWLVPTFQGEPSLGQLTVAGPFADMRTQKLLRCLEGHRELDARYLSEEALLRVARAQDYLLLLYDPWDRRMESAALYLAARANRPVVTFENGWCGRMVLKYRCGVGVTKDRNEALRVIRQLPRPGTADYRIFLDGLLAFRREHSSSARLAEFMSSING